MVRKLRQVRSDLRRAGFAITRQTGSHETWQHALLPERSVTLAGADSADAQPYQEREVRNAIAAAREAEQRERRKQQGR